MSATQTLTYSCPHCRTTVDVMPHSGTELVTCPACNKPFQVKVPEAEPVNRLILPAAALATPPENGTAPAETEVERQPNLVAENTADREEHLRTIHLDMVRRYPLRCLGYLAMFLGGLILGIVVRIEGWNLLSLALFGLAIYGVIRLVLWWLSMKNTTLTLTTQRVIVESGIFAKRTTEIPMKDIAEIQVAQNFFTRMVDVGDLVLLCAGAQRKQLVVMAVPHPTEVAATIRGQGVGKESVPH